MKVTPVYVISPCTGKGDIPRMRSELNCTILARLMDEAYMANEILAPVAPVALYPQLEGLMGYECSHAYWMELCKAQVHMHKDFILIPLQGILNSKGVAMELEWVRAIPDYTLRVVRSDFCEVTRYALSADSLTAAMLDDLELTWEYF